MIRIAVAGVTASGNMGGVAMLEATLRQMAKRVPGSEFSLLSISPESDRRVTGYEGLKIVPANAALLIGVYLPLSLLFWVAWRRNRLKDALCWIPYFRTLRDSDLLIDLSGISFVDGRGLALLLYNVAVFFPAVAYGVRVVKLSQALGPFRTGLNRRVARFCLRRCAAVVARGRVSLESLEELGIHNGRMLPDVTFCLDVPDQDRNAARDLLASRGIGPDMIVVSPSEVVRRYLDSEGKSYPEMLSDLIRRASELSLDTVILPHSYGRGKSKNNDINVCREIVRRVRSDVPNVWLIDDVRDPLRLRAILGNARVFVGSRFHSVVGALAMGVPSLTIGWSHKYREMAEMLAVEDFVLDYAQLNTHALIERFEALLGCEGELRTHIAVALEAVRRDAESNFDVACSALAAS